MKTWIVTLFLAVSLVFLAGCPKFAENAEAAIAGAGGVIQQAVEKYEPACVPEPDKEVCQLIKRAAALQRTAIDAMNLYCGGPGWNEDGPCNPPDSKDALNHAKERVRSAVNNMNEIIANVQGWLK